MSPPRVAFFPDSYSEVNGVALTSRQLEAYAVRQGRPFLTVHGGPSDESVSQARHVRLQLRRSVASFPVDHGLYFDLLLWRRRAVVRDTLRVFQPDVVHITGPSDIGMLGALVAHELRIPLVASWHTNLHEYAGRRAQRLCGLLPDGARERLGGAAERGSMDALGRFYRLARVLLAPNQELIDLLHARTGKDCHLMQRGVDTTLFDPAKRTRTDGPFTIGYVGRLSTEKNVRFLADLERELAASPMGPFRLLIVGQGAEREWLEQNLKHAEFPGVLRGEALARAYADMDLFVFPSQTDTYGNVVQEAQASGVPTVVTAGGGPKFLVRSGETGFVAATDSAFVRCVRELMEDQDLHARMREAARAHALTCSWDRVFDRVYQAYESAVHQAPSAVPAALKV